LAVAAFWFVWGLFSRLIAWLIEWLYETLWPWITETLLPWLRGPFWRWIFYRVLLPIWSRLPTWLTRFLMSAYGKLSAFVLGLGVAQTIGKEIVKFLGKWVWNPIVRIWDGFWDWVWPPPKILLTCPCAPMTLGPFTAAYTYSSGWYSRLWWSVASGGADAQARAIQGVKNEIAQKLQDEANKYFCPPPCKLAITPLPIVPPGPSVGPATFAKGYVFYTFSATATATASVTIQCK
jgi:hypothetical protein